jgi:spore coat protein U-like protein
MIVALFFLAWASKPASAASCSTWADSLVFGNYSGGQIDVTGAIKFRCDTAGTPFQVGLNAGIAPGATITNRMMYGGTGGSNTLGYQLFSNASRTLNWGNSSGTGWVTGTAAAAWSAQPITVYARIPANENSPSGNYTDTITASVTGSFTTAMATFSVTTNLAPSCTISANALNFGSYTGSQAARSSPLAR